MPNAKPDLSRIEPMVAGDLPSASALNTITEAVKSAMNFTTGGIGTRGFIDRDGILIKPGGRATPFEPYIGAVITVGDVFAMCRAVTGPLPYPIISVNAPLVKVYIGEESAIRPEENGSFPDVLYCLPIPSKITNYRWWAVHMWKGFRFAQPPVEKMSPVQYPPDFWSAPGDP